MAYIYLSREDAQKQTQANSVLISAQLRNPVRYPSVWVSSEIYSNLAHVPDQYRELLRAILTERIEAVIRDAVKEGKSSIDSSLLTEEHLLSEATAKASTRLSKEEFMAQFWASALGKVVAADKRTRPAIAAKMEAAISSLHSVKAAGGVSEAQTAQVLTVLSKPQFSVDSEAQWYLQALASIEGAAAKRASADLGDAY